MNYINDSNLFKPISDSLSERTVWDHTVLYKVV